MITRAYYSVSPITASINVVSLSNSKPTGYRLYVSHEVNGILFNEELPTAEKALSKATTLGCDRESWKVYQVDLNIDSKESK